MAAPRPLGAVRAAPKAASAVAAQTKGSGFSREPFSASLIIHGKYGTYKGKIYAGPDALRTDVGLSSGVIATVIVRYDKGVEWILMPSRHYVETPIDESGDLLSAMRDQASRVKSRDLGPETVGTHPCEKYRVEVSDRRRKLSGWIWVARSKAMPGFIVRAQDQASGMSVELSDIRLALPAPSLFDLPAGYHQIIKASKAPRSVHR